MPLYLLCVCCSLFGLALGLAVNTLTLYDAQSSALLDKSQYYQLLNNANPALTEQFNQSLKTVTLPYHLCQTRSLHQMLKTAGLHHNSVNELLQNSYALYQLETEQQQQAFCLGKEFNWF